MNGEMSIPGGQVVNLRQSCNAAAPAVVNGSPYVGCSKEAEHADDHEIVIRWPRR